jgi:signal transduction histidine kinase
MDARTLERAVDEFFTTKASGSGLGLSYAARVARAHRGSLAVESAVGRGTVVRFRLPVVV